jgi:glycosyltransferase involved in cell wall biosynthesis
MRNTDSDGFEWRSWLYTWSVENIERSFVENVSQVWSCSSTDAKKIRSLYDPSPVHVVPNTLDVFNYASVRVERQSKDGHPVIAFVGSFGYAPNRRAAEVLIDEVLPRVQTVYRDSRLYLVGSSPTSYMRRRALENEAVVVTGFVDDVCPYLSETDIIAIPLTEGSGTRLKAIEAFASKIPVVTTRKGVEGLNVEHGESVLIADAPERMAEQIVALYENLNARKKISKRAFEIMKKQYSWESSERAITDGLKEAV